MRKFEGEIFYKFKTVPFSTCGVPLLFSCTSHGRELEDEGENFSPPLYLILRNHQPA